jgi:hypothetical protein
MNQPNWLELIDHCSTAGARFGVAIRSKERGLAVVATVNASAAAIRAALRGLRLPTRIPHARVERAQLVRERLAAHGMLPAAAILGGVS